MKINSIKTRNFMGLKGVYTIDMPHIAALIGKNGIGKSTILTAIRYALTGEDPSGDIIHKDCEECSVSLYLTDPADGSEIEFERIKNRTKPSKSRLNGKATTAKSMNEKLESIVSIPLDKIKILSSADIVAAMKPQEFASFILSYVPEKMKVDDVISIISDSTIGMVNIIEANLPEEVDLDSLDEFAELCKYNRKELKKQIESKKAALMDKPVEKPSFDRKELEEQLSVINASEAEVRVYKAKKDSYDRAVVSRNKQQLLLESLKKEIAENKAERPDLLAKKKIEEKEKSLRDSIQNQRIAISGASSALKQLEITLEALEKPICPISPLITCHQDKTVAKEDISESIIATKEGIAAMEKEASKTEKELVAMKTELNVIRENEIKYNQKISAMKQVKALEESNVELPENPEEPKVVNVEEQKNLIRIKLDEIKSYEYALEISKQIEVLSDELSDYEKLVKATAENGCIRTAVISKYLGVFEELCNKRSTSIRPEIDFKFKADKGVVVLMNNGKGSYLPYSSLSGGEQAYMLFILMDMLNSLCGSNILMLDELSVIDEVCFNALLDIVCSYASEYDHILLAAVNHDDTIRAVEVHHVPIMSIAECRYTESLVS